MSKLDREKWGLLKMTARNFAATVERVLGCDDESRFRFERLVELDYEQLVKVWANTKEENRVPDANLLRGSGQPVRRKPPFTDRVDPPVACAACAEGEALANGKHFIDTGSANSGVIMKGCPISRVEFNKMFGVTE